MSLESIGSFIGSLVNPLATLITEKITGCFGKNLSPSGQVVVQILAFILLLIPVTLLALALAGMVIFSFQMLNASI